MINYISPFQFQAPSYRENTVSATIPLGHTSAECTLNQKEILGKVKGSQESITVN